MTGVYKVTLGAAVWYSPNVETIASMVSINLYQAELIQALRPGAYLDFDYTGELTGGRPARCRIERRESIPVPSSAIPVGGDLATFRALLGEAVQAHRDGRPFKAEGGL